MDVRKLRLNDKLVLIAPREHEQVISDSREPGHFLASDGHRRRQFARLRPGRLASSSSPASTAIGVRSS